MLECQHCHIKKEHAAFRYVPKRKSTGVCKDCEHERNKTWLKEHPEQRRASRRRYRQKHPDKVRQYEKITRWADRLLQHAKTHSKTRNHAPPTIDKAWILRQPMFCPYLGIPLSPSTEQRSLRAPSLDRIDNTKGYTPENTRLTSWAWNQMRNSASVSDALSLVAEIRLTALMSEVA